MICSPRWPKYRASRKELLEMLGLSPTKHLPIAFGPRTVQGHKVVISSTASAQANRPDSYKPHRLEVQCNRCYKWFSYGRLEQHERACLRKEASS